MPLQCNTKNVDWLFDSLLTNPIGTFALVSAHIWHTLKFFAELICSFKTQAFPMSQQIEYIKLFVGSENICMRTRWVLYIKAGDDVIAFQYSPNVSRQSNKMPGGGVKREAWSCKCTIHVSHHMYWFGRIATYCIMQEMNWKFTQDFLCFFSFWKLKVPTTKSVPRSSKRCRSGFMWIRCACLIIMSKAGSVGFLFCTAAHGRPL